MIITCNADIRRIDYNKILSEIKEKGFEEDILRGLEKNQRPIIGLKGDCSTIDTGDFLKLKGVSDVKRISNKYKLASREYNLEDTVVKLGNISIGNGYDAVFMAGPCAVESEHQILRIAEEVKQQGAVILRGGAFKPRTYARSFEGLGEEGLKYLKKAKEKT